MGYNLFLFTQLIRDMTTIYDTMNYEDMFDDVKEKYRDYLSSEYSDNMKQFIRKTYTKQLKRI